MSLFRWEKNTADARTWECVCARLACARCRRSRGVNFTSRSCGTGCSGERGKEKKGGRMGELVGRWASVPCMCAFLFCAPGPREWFIALGELVPSPRSVHTHRYHFNEFSLNSRDRRSSKSQIAGNQLPRS